MAAAIPSVDSSEPVRDSCSRRLAIRNACAGFLTMRSVRAALIDDYIALIVQLERDLAELGVELAATVADTAELVRGYEEVKLRGVHAYRAQRAELGYPIGAALAQLLDHCRALPGSAMRHHTSAPAGFEFARYGHTLWMTCKKCL